MAKQIHMEQTRRRGYQWPASALTGEEMEILTTMRKKTGKSIAELLRQSVHHLGERRIMQ